MPGAEVPAAGAIGLDTVTNAQQELNLEALAEVLRRTPGTGVASISADVISAGVVTPTRGIVVVDTEGAVSSDNLDRIDPGAYLQGSLILVRPAATGRTVVVRHMQGGSGQVFLLDASPFSLSTTLKAILLRLDATQWVEVTRFQGGDLVSARAALGLGSVATFANGAVDAATLEGQAAAAFLPVGGTAANSLLLGGLAAAAFVRGDLAALQTMAGSLKVMSGILRSRHPSVAGVPILELQTDNGGGSDVTRTRLYFDGVNQHAILQLMDAAGTTVLGGLRLRSGSIPDYWDSAVPGWVPLFQASDLLPDLQRVRWDKTSPATRYTPSGLYVMQAEAAPFLPGTGATAIYRIAAGITGSLVGGSNPSWSARVYVGPNGDQTDTLVAESPTVATTVGTPTVTAEVAEGDYQGVPVAAGDFVTLVLNKLDGVNLDVEPSVLSGYLMDKRTYLRVEQIG